LLASGGHNSNGKLRDVQCARLDVHELARDGNLTLGKPTVPVCATESAWNGIQNATRALGLLTLLAWALGSFVAGATLADNFATPSIY
jgi:hypothetical protein